MSREAVYNILAVAVAVAVAVVLPIGLIIVAFAL
jgi:hypothetical protein